MRVLNLISTLGSGGAERQLSLVAPALALDGVDMHVAFVNGGPNLPRLENSGAVLHRLRASSNHDPRLPAGVLRLVDRLKPDVVQTWLLQMDILGGAAALFHRTPLIVSERSQAEAYPATWKTRLRLEVGKRAAAVVANSQGGLAYWQRHVPSDRLHLVRNCVTPPSAPVADTPHPLMADLGSAPLVMFAGRFSAEKNICTLIEALAEVARRIPEVAIRLFGEGPEKERAASRIAELGLSRQMLVAPYSTQLSVWMGRATVCVSVSHFEGHPNVVMEAAAAGCPLVLSDISAHRELFDSRSASLVPPDAVGRIADAVIEAMHNPALARNRADRAREVAARCDLASAARAYRSIYEASMSTARRRTPVSSP